MQGSFGVKIRVLSILPNRVSGHSFDTAACGGSKKLFALCVSFLRRGHRLHCTSYERWSYEQVSMTLRQHAVETLLTIRPQPYSLAKDPYNIRIRPLGIFGVRLDTRPTSRPGVLAEGAKESECEPVCWEGASQHTIKDQAWLEHFE